MKAVLKKSESEILMNTPNENALSNNADTETNPLPNIDSGINSVPSETVEQNIFDTIKTLLVDSADIDNQILSVRGQLFNNCVILSLDPNYDIYTCNVVNENKSTISKDEINNWIKSVYDSGLYKTYKNLVFEDFSKDIKSNKFYSHYRALKDIAISVQMFIGNFHNGSRQLDQIPFCKVEPQIANGQTVKQAITPLQIFLNGDEILESEIPALKDEDILEYKVEEKGDFFIDNEIYMRLSFLNNLPNSKQFPIKDRVMVSKNGFTEETVQNIKDGIQTYKSFSIHQIIDIAETVINFTKVTEKIVVTEAQALKDNFDGISKMISKTVTEGKEKNSHIFNSAVEKKLLATLDRYIDTALTISDWSAIKKVLLQISETINTNGNNKKFQEYLNKQKFLVLIEQNAKDSSRYNQIIETIKKF